LNRKNIDLENANSDFIAENKKLNDLSLERLEDIKNYKRQIA